MWYKLIWQNFGITGNHGGWYGPISRTRQIIRYDPTQQPFGDRKYSTTLPQAKEKYRGMFQIQKSGDKTSSGEIGLDIRTHASPKF